MLNTILMAEQLKGEYRTAFEKVDMYRMLQGDDVATDDEKMMELYDALTQAQHNEEPVEKIVGQDIEAFCKAFWSQEDKENVGINALRYTYHLLKWVFICILIDIVALGADGQIRNIESDLMPFVCGLVIGIVLSSIAKYVFSSIIFKSKKLTPALQSFIVVVAFLIAIIGSAILLSNVSVNINSMLLLGVSGGYVLVYLVIRSVWRYKQHGKITRLDTDKRKMEKEFNAELRDANMQSATVEILTKQYNKIYQKKKQKGENYTYEEFAGKVRKRVLRHSIWKKVVLIFIAVIVLAPTIEIICTDGLIDGLIFLAIMLAVEGVIYYYFFHKMGTKSMQIQWDILQQCEEQNMTISEYAEYKKHID